VGIIEFKSVKYPFGSTTVWPLTESDTWESQVSATEMTTHSPTVCPHAAKTGKDAGAVQEI